VSLTKAQDEIRTVCQELANFLLEKNRKYGNSAIEPVRIFSRADPIEQINVRLDDKLARIRNRQDDEDEDVEMDLLGYLVLKEVARRLEFRQVMETTRLDSAAREHVASSPQPPWDTPSYAKSRIL
jgi:hypothetical protein